MLSLSLQYSTEYWSEATRTEVVRILSAWNRDSDGLNEIYIGMKWSGYIETIVIPAGRIVGSPCRDNYFLSEHI